MRPLLVATAALIIFMAGAPAGAQQQPKPFPWERKSEIFLNPRLDDPSKAFRRRLDEDLRKLGLAPHAPTMAAPDTGIRPGRPSDGGARYQRFDTNRDGYISKREYMSGRARPYRLGPTGTARRSAARSRLNSRFRAADANRDGRISPDEIDGLRGSRF